RERRREGEKRRDDEQDAVRPRREDHFLEEQLEHVRERLQEAARAHAVRADAALHVADDLALGQRQERHREDEAGEDHRDLHHHVQRVDDVWLHLRREDRRGDGGEDLVPQELEHGPYAFSSVMAPYQAPSPARAGLPPCSSTTPSARRSSTVTGSSARLPFWRATARPAPSRPRDLAVPGETCSAPSATYGICCSAGARRTSGSVENM